MDHNSSIGCNVTECKHHCKDDDYCTLDKINVVKNNKIQHFVGTNQENTDCGSFELE